MALEIRKTIFNGSFHNCNRKRCPHLNEKTRPLQKLVTLEEGQVRHALTTGGAQLNYLPKQLNLCFDHSCNLACPSCRQQRLQARGAAKEQAEQLPTIIRQQLLPTAETITLSGFGDPFGSPTYLQFLRQINRSDLPHLQAVRLHSNGQLLTAQLWNSLPELQSLITEVEISIDAAAAVTYQVNRPGGNFARLLENLDFLSQQACQLSLSMVVQKNNWEEIPQLIKLAEGFGARVYLSRLVNWGTFSREEFQQRAIDQPQHLEHKNFKKSLRHYSDMPLVDIGNLRPLID